MANNAEAEEAIKSMNGRNLSGRTIRVNQAEERKPRDNAGAPRRRF
jgi:RNA recognition motif-containing protein